MKPAGASAPARAPEPARHGEQARDFVARPSAPVDSENLGVQPRQQHEIERLHRAYAERRDGYRRRRIGSPWRPGSLASGRADRAGAAVQTGGRAQAGTARRRRAPRRSRRGSARPKSRCFRARRRAAASARRTRPAPSPASSSGPAGRFGPRALQALRLRRALGRPAGRSAWTKISVAAAVDDAPSDGIASGAVGAGTGPRPHRSSRCRARACRSRARARAPRRCRPGGR